MSDVALKMSEKSLQEAVVDLAHVFGWKVAHFRPALTSAGNWVTPVAADGAGFVDLVLCKDRILFVELKATRGQISPAQADWGARLLMAGANYLIWRPEDWRSGEIERVLR
jgi:hypothetical protein